MATHLLGRNNGYGVFGGDGDVVRAVGVLLPLHRPAELRTHVSACAHTHTHTQAGAAAQASKQASKQRASRRYVRTFMAGRC